jgi:hypothetical protein
MLDLLRLGSQIKPIGHCELRQVVKFQQDSYFVRGSCYYYYWTKAENIY